MDWTLGEKNVKSGKFVRLLYEKFNFVAFSNFVTGRAEIFAELIVIEEILSGL